MAGKVEIPKTSVDTAASLRKEIADSPESANKRHAGFEKIKELQVGNLDLLLSKMALPPAESRKADRRIFESTMQGWRFTLLTVLNKKLDAAYSGLQNKEINPAYDPQIKEAADLAQAEVKKKILEIAGHDGDPSYITLGDLQSMPEFSFEPKVREIMGSTKGLVSVDQDDEGEEFRTRLRGPEDVAKYRQVYELTKSHLTTRAKQIAESGLPGGSKAAFLAEVQTVLLQTVGAQRLRMKKEFTDETTGKKLQGFQQIWEELAKDPNVDAILKSDQENTRAEEALVELIEDENEQAERKLTELLRAPEPKDLPRGTSLGKMFLVLAKVWGGATMVLNMLISNKNFYKNGAFWGGAAALAAASYFDNPNILRGKSEEHKAADEYFRSRVEDSKRPLLPQIQKCLSAIPGKELAPSAKLGELLGRKLRGEVPGGQQIGTTELKSVLPKTVADSIAAVETDTIPAGSPEALELFHLLAYCSTNNLDPQKYIESEDDA